MGEKTYSHASHIDKVIKASAARNSARLVLCEMCRLAKFDRPEVTVSKSQLIRSTGYTRRTVQLALQWLREEGSIVPTVPLQDFVPGRGKAVTYRLHVVGQGGQDAPADDAQGAGQGGKATADEEGQGAQEQETGPDPVITRMREIQAERPGISVMRAYEVAQAETEGPKE